MDPVTVACEACGVRDIMMKRYPIDIAVKTIAEVLDMTVADAMEFLQDAEDHRKAAHTERSRA